MKSRTSYSKLTPFKKDIFRFAPVWVLYLIGMMLILMSQGSYYTYDRFACNVITDIIPGFGVINLIYAGLVAQLLFGDLYNTRMCYSLHSLPQRRESWLLSHLAAGVLFCLAPNVVAALFLMIQLESYWFIALLWLLAMLLQYLFFFGLATVSAMLSGNRFAQLAIYAGFNFVSMLAYATVQYLYIPTITGVVANIADFSRFSPVVYLYEFEFLRFNPVEIQVPTIYPGKYDYETFYEFAGLADGWGYSAILGGLGLAAMGISLWLYRIRHLESAGDFIAFPKLKAPSCVIITLCVTLCAAIVGDMFDGGLIIWLAVGLIVGYFGSLMLLERRIKVFRKKTFLGFGILVIVTILSFCAVGMDWFGIESWTPSADRVESVTVANYNSSNFGYDNDYYYNNRLSATLEDEADIEQIIQAHEDILSRLDFRQDYPNAKTHRVVLTYKMKSGRTVIRSYNAPADGVNYEIVNRYLYTAEAVLGFTDPAQAAQNVDYLIFADMELPQNYYEDFFLAVQADYKAGSIRYDKNDGEYYLEYRIRNSDGVYVNRYMNVSEEAANLMALLKDPALQIGYTDWETFPEQILYLYFEGMELYGQDRVALLEAIRKDVEAGNLRANNYKSNGDILFMVEYEYHNGNTAGYRTFLIDKLAENTLQWWQEYSEKLDEGNPEGV